MNDTSIKKENFFDCSNAVDFFKCPKCARFKSDSLIHLLDHLRARHTLFRFKKNPPHKCASCCFQTFSKFLFSEHEYFNVCGKIPPLSETVNACGRCSYTTRDPRSLKRHISVKHTDPDDIQWFECANCSYKCRTQQTLKCHMDRNHHDQEHLKCDHCPFETLYTHKLKYHILWKHTEPEKIQWFACEQCPVKTRTKSDLRKHLDRIHGAGKCLKCDRCPFETRFSFSLKSHLMTQHTDLEKIQWFQCAHCPHKCKTKSNLTRHVSYNHGVQEYLKCDRCPFETRAKNSMKYHVMSKHTEPEKIQWLRCAQCEFKSKSRSNLKKHVEYKHEEPARLKCDQCEFEAKSKLNLKVHVQRRHSQKDETQWFQCEHCPYRSPIRQNLYQHRHRRHSEAASIVTNVKKSMV